MSCHALTTSLKQNKLISQAVEQDPSTYNPDFLKAILENLWECKAFAKPHMPGNCWSPEVQRINIRIGKKTSMKSWIYLFSPVRTLQLKSQRAAVNRVESLAPFLLWLSESGAVTAQPCRKSFHGGRPQRKSISIWYPGRYSTCSIRIPLIPMAILENHLHGPSLTSFHAVPKDSDLISDDFGLVFSLF